jgi:hypothetical protein
MALLHGGLTTNKATDFRDGNGLGDVWVWKYVPAIIESVGVSRRGTAHAYKHLRVAAHG